MTTVYDAFVSADGKADYVLPSAAFADGKKRIFVQPGVYYETKDVSVPSGATMIGANRGTTIIDFANNAASVTCDASYGTIESKGTISITSDSKMVTGTGTYFNSIPAGNRYIYLNDRAFAISSIANDTSLELVNVYRGSALSGAPYKAMTMESCSQLSNFTIRNSASKGLFVSGYLKASISNVIIENCAEHGLYVDNCTECSFLEMDANFGGVNGYSINASTYCQFNRNNALSNAGYGFLCDANCSNLVVTCMQASANDTNFYIDGVDNCLVSSMSNHAKNDGIVVNNTTNKIVACASTYNGHDNVHVLSTADNTLIVAVNFNVAGSTEFNNESATTGYAATYP